MCTRATLGARLHCVRIVVERRSWQDPCCSRIIVAARSLLQPFYELLCCVLFRFFAEQGGSEGFFGVPETAAHAAQIVFDDWG